LKSFSTQRCLLRATSTVRANATAPKHATAMVPARASWRFPPLINRRAVRTT